MASRKVVRALARDAYRRPPTEVELDVLVPPAVMLVGFQTQTGNAASGVAYPPNGGRCVS